MEYEKPVVSDYGNLLEITAGDGTIGDEDASGKQISAGVPGVAELSVSLFP